MAMAKSDLVGRLLLVVKTANSGLVWRIVLKALSAVSLFGPGTWLTNRQEHSWVM